MSLQFANFSKNKFFVFPSRALAALLLGLFFFQGLFLIRATSPTTDEVAFHAVNGYVYLKTHDYRMSPANPPLIREWSALPWLLLRPKLDLNNAFWKEADSVPFSLKFFYQDNRSVADPLLYSARFMILILGVWMGWVIYAWSRRLYGDGGGLLSLALYSFCPNFLAYSSLATIDAGPAFFCTLAAYRLWRYLEKDSAKNFWALSLSLAAAFAAKYSTLFLGPVFLGIILFKKGFGAFFKAAAAFAFASFWVIWASYGFEFKPLLAGGVPRVGEKLGFIAAGIAPFFHGAAASIFQQWAKDLPIPAPTYLLGVAGIVRNHRIGFPHYLFGRWSSDWCWHYYFFSFLVKMTMSFLILLALRIVFWKKTSSVSAHEKATLLVPVIVMSGLVCFDTFAMGIRYLFPVIPLLYVWIGGLSRLGASSRRWKWTLSALLAAHIAASLSVFPNQLSFFNSFVGGPGGAWRYIRGSDLDWGQGLKALGAYLKKNDIGKVRLMYFGTADPSFYGIDFEKPDPDEYKSPKAGVYAISLFYLEHAAWTKTHPPKAIVGGSIAIYDFRG